MKTLTRNEIARTAFKVVGGSKATSPYGYTHPNRDANEMCPYCKNEDTEVVRDLAYLTPFKEFYGSQKFTVVHCTSCTAIFSFGTPNIQQEPKQ